MQSPRKGNLQYTFTFLTNDFSGAVSSRLRLSKKSTSDLTWNVSSSDLSQLTESNVRTYKKQAEINAANHKVINKSISVTHTPY